MEPRITSTSGKLLVGMHLTMSLVNNRTRELWSGFRPRVNEINNRLGNDFINLQIYDPDYHMAFNPAREFEAWALVEVEDLANIPDGMQAFSLPPGEYAVFVHVGGPAKASETMQYIFTEWLPSSGYFLDNRPHFEVLGEKYSNSDPNSEEEMWIPIKGS